MKNRFKNFLNRNICAIAGNKAGSEMVQVAILIAIAVAVGLIFKTEITGFVNRTFSSLK